MQETAEMEHEPEAAASAVALAPDVAAPEHPSSQFDVFKNRVRLLCDSNTAHFDAWVSLITAAEETSSDDIEVISLVYHSFLLEFPLCYGYWIKYAAHKARLCTNGDVVEVYEQAVQAVPHSVDLWVSYCGFGTRAYEDPAGIRSLFERALSLVGKDYLCYHLWDKYIEFEHSQKQPIQLATIYINTLKFSTKKLHKYYESFRKFVTLLEQEVTHCVAERLSENIHTSEDVEDSELDTSTVIADLFDQKGGCLRPEALKQYLYAGEYLYQRSSKIYKEICCFEASIKRPFFHVKPLDDDQLENWHQYLDYVEKNGDFDWAVKLYERCLIPCANYSEFWIRYAEYVDAKGGREIAIYALGRASSCFVKGVPTFCMYYAMFKEQIGDAPAARSLFVKASSNFTSGFYANINRLANMEKRMGNTKAASEIYETAIEDAMHKQNIEILPDLYSNFAQFIYVATRSIGKAIEVFVKGIKRAPCKSMIKGLIQFMSTYGGPTEIPLLDSVISNAVAPGSDVSTALSPEDREDISLLFLEFVDLYGGVKELRKAWARHSKLFPHSSRNVSQQYCATGNCLQESSKRRRTESSMVAHDHSLEGTRKLKLSSKTDNFSLIVDKEVESQADRNTAASVKGYRDAEEQKALVHHEASRTAQECTDMVHSQHSLDESGMQNQMHSHAKQATDQDLSLREQNDEKANSHQAQSEKAPEAESGNCDSPSKATAHSDKIDSQDKVIEAPASSHPETVCSKSDSPSGASMLKEGSSSAPPQISLELVERQPVKVQVKLDTEHDVSVSNANPEGSNDNPNTSQCGREVSALGQESQDQIQSSQSQQLSVCVKPSSSELAEIKTNTMCFQAQVQHQVDNSQTHVSNNLLLVGENMQQQGLSFTMPQNVQTSSQTPGQLLTQPNQGNQQYLQMMQGYASQMWQYYQQQLYYLQAQHNQQMQSLQQQQLPTEHLQQNFMQQVQQLNQQMVLWQQQVQQQQQQQQQQLLQQALPVQQQSDIKQGPYHSSSGDSKHEQNKQQQQESQMDHQSQQLQQQQLLYFQQQQQQQMYIMQQQQQQKMYQQQQTQQPQLLQQQQLMQQKQYLSQMPQQQQDSVQQQQLFQQQQQQMVLLQQQRQQFIQQHMQQYVQQQQNQQGPKDQNYKLNPQDGRNWQMEHGQQCETSQSDGSKLRSGEQSELSYPSTPQSQRSNH